MSDAAFIGQVIAGIVTTCGALIAGISTYRSGKLVQDVKTEEHASTVLLAALKAERRALEKERDRAERERDARNTADDETHDCEEELQLVHAALAANDIQMAQLRERIRGYEAHVRECEQLRREFDQLRADVISGHTSGEMAE